MIGLVHDPLTERWIISWAAMRDLQVTELDGWPLVHVASRTRQTELVCVDPGVAAFGELLRHVGGDRGAMLTVVGADLSAYREMPLPDDVRVDRDDESLMTTHLVGPAAAPALPESLVGTWDIDAGLVHHRVEDGERVVAEGAMGLHDGWATFDSVETAPSHQRRGLGRHVMTALVDHAHEEGAQRAVLAASADGRALYESLGWRVERELLSLMGTSG